MDSTNEMLLNLVEEVLGPHRPTSKADNHQKYFNCKSRKCYKDHNKYNLAYHDEKRIFRCWKCNARGTVSGLVSSFGNKVHKDKLKVILPYQIPTRSFFSKPESSYENVTCELPKEYLPLSEYRDTFKYKQALNYVINKRKITMEQIKEYNIGYTEEGNRKLRIIIPSYNKNGDVNYYEARSYWEKIKMTYIKPDSPSKDDIIFFESRINWDLPVFLVEGVFDAIRIPNAIPMLGKIPSDYLVMKILEHKPKTIICIDEDAIKDAYGIYEDLASLDIDMGFIDMTGKEDVSKIFEDKGVEGIKGLLNTIGTIDFITFFRKLLKYNV